MVQHGYYPSDTRVRKEVRALVEAGHEVDVICLRASGERFRERVDGVRVCRMPHVQPRGSIMCYVFEYGLPIFLMSMELVLRFLYRHYRVIQVHTPPDSLVFCTLLPRLFGARVLLDLHEPSPELLLAKCEGQVSEWILRLQIMIEKVAIRYASQVITVNDTIRSRFVERGAPPDKIEVVRNVPAEDFGKGALPAPQHDGLVLMTHGTLESRYGESVVLHALPLIRKELDSVRLVIAGAGETLDELKQLAVKLRCDDITEFTGFVPGEKIAELISQADIGIVPLLPGPFSELCQPNKLFEYIALKTAVVTSRLQGIEESLDPRCLCFFEAGNAADLAEAVIKLGRDASLRASFADQAYAVYQNLRWDKAKLEYLRVVDSLSRRSENEKA